MKSFSLSVMYVLVAVSAFLFLPHAASAMKVTVSPSSVTLPENGGSQVYTVQLDEPIIAESGDAFATISITSTDTRVVTSPQVINFDATDWFNTKTFTVTTIGDFIHNTQNEVTLSFSTFSNSEYYNGHRTSATITLVDDDSAGGAVLLFGCKIPTATNYNPNGGILADDTTCVFAKAGDCAPGAAFSSVTGARCPNNSPSTAAKFTFQKNLKKGMDDADVLQLQKFLNTYGSPVAVSGTASLGNEVTTFGQKTFAALVQYQKSHGILPATGYFGPTTRAHVNAILEKEN